REWHGQVYLVDRHGDDREDEQRRADHHVGADLPLDCFRIRMHARSYSRYKTGNRKIQTRSTKCQYSPVYSIRFVNWSGLFFQSFAPGPRKYAITIMPPTMCSPCSPVSV